MLNIEKKPFRNILKLDSIFYSSSLTNESKTSLNVLFLRFGGVAYSSCSMVTSYE